MGIVELTKGKRVYLDANVFIYAIEGFRGLEDELRQFFKAVDDGRVTGVTSELTLAEVLVKPFAEGRQRHQETYQRLLHRRSFLQLHEVSREVLITAARMRAKTVLKLPDAIHLATAQSAACDAFLTNDPDFRNAADMPVIMLSDLDEEG